MSLARPTTCAAVMVVLSALALSPHLALAQPAPRPARHPDEAGPDFAIQGEYAGQLDDGTPLGVQVMALGHGRFRARAFVGGLPADGWDGTPPTAGEGTAVDGVVELVGQHGSGRIADGVMTLADSSGQVVGRLPRIERASPTLGARPPDDARVLFDGTHKEHFTGGRVMEDGSLTTGVRTVDSFGDMRLHLEFKVPFMPGHRGQDRGNSGVYLQERYEVQILDSFGLDPRDNECGALYGLRAPNINASLPPLTWQTYDIHFRAARFDEAGERTAPAMITVRHNGVRIHEDFELPHESPRGRAETGGRGPIYLQFHLCPVEFRNIWLVEPTDDE